MRLSAIAKKIIVQRLYDKRIQITESELDHYIVDESLFPDYNSMYDAIVNNYGKLIVS